jgi:hypothetical protein
MTSGPSPGSSWTEINSLTASCEQVIGTFTTFDAPGSGTGSFIGTIPARINAGGVVVGTFYDTNFVLHASYGHWTEQLPYWMLQARAPKGLRGPLRWT